MTDETADDWINAEFDRMTTVYDRRGRRVLMPNYPHHADLAEQIRYTLCEKFKMEIECDRCRSNPTDGLHDYLDKVDRMRAAYDAHLTRIVGEFRSYYPGGDAIASEREIVRISNQAEADARSALAAG